MRAFSLWKNWIPGFGNDFSNFYVELGRGETVRIIYREKLLHLTLVHLLYLFVYLFPRKCPNQDVTFLDATSNIVLVDRLLEIFIC